MHLTDSIEKDSLDTIAVVPEPLPCYVRDWGKKDKNDPSTAALTFLKFSRAPPD